LSKEEESKLNILLKHKVVILVVDESKWWLKSRVILLHEGDTNSKFFHSYENHRRNLTSIYEINSPDSIKVSSFQEIVNVGVSYFSHLFKAYVSCPIQEIPELVNLFPRKIYDEVNESLLAEIEEEEVLATLEAFQISKILGLDGLSVEFFLGFYDLIKEDLLKTVQESQRSSKVLGALNKIFLALIPNKNESCTFEDFRSIFFCT
jgi:hypothetical protein